LKALHYRSTGPVFSQMRGKAFDSNNIKLENDTSVVRQFMMQVGTLMTFMLRDRSNA
jgi:hypothetical protein